MILLNARDGPVDAEHTQDEYVALVAALIAVPGSLLTLGVDVDEQPAPVEDEQWMRFFVGHGGFVGRGALRNELVEQLVSLAKSRRHLPPRNTTPTVRWKNSSCGYGLSFDELQAFAFALHAGSKIAETEELPNLVVGQSRRKHFEEAQRSRERGRADVRSDEWMVGRWCNHLDEAHDALDQPAMDESMAFVWARRLFSGLRLVL